MKREWSEERRLAHSERLKAPEVRAKLSAAAKKRHTDPAFRQRTEKAYAKRRLRTVERDLKQLAEERARLLEKLA